ncbi:hypothetical protein GCM10029976_044130 [Kribbella albertanoniae]|uniref:DUF3592 domain-containing protein n=1 Tax=Kribbella albertanoniae TaxID=1266829 RepID=A0A4R4PMN7_9ACTN|nr:DUF3592 domain-containing protein [Kribbella albertanoniae]TDC23441.1 DUF3592 domain-containing protein [Kribbella albertanoniae]
MERRSLDFRAVGAFVVALGFVVAACVQSADVYFLRERGVVVTGTVLKEHDTRKSSWVEVRYVTLAGDEIVNDTSRYKSAEVGQPIDVIYDRQNPERMQAADWGLGYGFNLLVFGGFAALLVLAGILQLKFKLLTRLRGIAVR